VVLRVLAVVLALIACGCGSKDKPPPAPRCTPAPPAVAGEATHYEADGTGKCSFEASGDLLVAALNGTDYARGSWCGACLVVAGPDDTEIIVRVVDKCPGCKQGDLDLSEEAFALLAPLSKGRIPITWLPVPCEVAGPIAYRFKERSNAFWTGLQIRNHRYPVSSVEARDDLGTYRPLQRADYNYFVAYKGLGRGPYALRVTDTRGHMIEEMIAAGDGVTRTGVMQFPLCR
jgi:expansin (peptidoglycan-binding protein)